MPIFYSEKAWRKQIINWSMPAARCSSVSQLTDKKNLRRTEPSSSSGSKHESSTAKPTSREILTTQSQPDLRKSALPNRDSSGEKDGKKKVVKIRKKKKVALLANLALTKYSLGK